MVCPANVVPLFTSQANWASCAAVLITVEDAVKLVSRQASPDQSLASTQVLKL
jgi:hypothetical protein